MLFNSYAFLFGFLPVTLVGFAAACRTGRAAAPVWWLSLASLFFYGYWAPRYLGVLLASILANYALGRLLARPAGDDARRARARRTTLALGVALNLLGLAWYKYAGFLVEVVNAAAGTRVALAPIVLPLGISFFTFTQIAYLVDTYRRPEETRGDFGEYLLFVSFFPHLLAGPIVHHGQLMPQMATPGFRTLRGENLLVGGAIFLAGLGKKVLLADAFVDLATPVFGAAEAGASPTFVVAWVGALGYTLQLYFDFSGYSDMAIGLARMFGVHFPDNFDSPYKARSISDFWRRWHMTLSAFLRDYLYVPLGGNRKGDARRYLNLFLTMLLGGIWHGAGFTFAIWGALHGFYLVVNHGWMALRAKLGRAAEAGRAWTLAGSALTFLAVVVGWVFFRAESVAGAGRILAGMGFASGVELPAKYLETLGPIGDALVRAGVRAGELSSLGRPLWEVAIYLAVGYAIVWLAPNTTEVFERTRLVARPPARPRAARLAFAPTALWGVAFGVLLAFSLASVAGKTEFIYFQF